jgi:hypothetical protein
MQLIPSEFTIRIVCCKKVLTRHARGVPNLDKLELRTKDDLSTRIK